jgi:hypothetical protein
MLRLLSGLLLFLASAAWWWSGAGGREVRCAAEEMPT